MAEGTRVSQVSEALSKLKEDCKAENQRVSKLADSFRVQQDALAKLQAENKAFQSRMEESLHVIMETLANKASEHVAGKVIEHGETSGEHSTFIPPTGEGETAIPKVTVEGEMSAPKPNNSFIPSATDGGGINPRSVIQLIGCSRHNSSLFLAKFRIIREFLSLISTWKGRRYSGTIG